MTLINKIFNVNFLIFFSIIIFLTTVNHEAKSQLEDLDNAVSESMGETIGQVKNIDLGEANSELAQGIDSAMEKMGEGMDFALEALNNSNPELALATMEMLETTMDMAIDTIPSEEFMDFSKINLGDFSPEELAAAQSMMGDMMTQDMGVMTKMMENMGQVEGAGFDMGGFMDTMDTAGFGFETMFGENMESMTSMFGEDMSMMGMMEGMEMSPEMMEAFSGDPGSMEMGDMMGMVTEMGDMTAMMSEGMNFENFSGMATMMDGSQMDTMTEGMMEMMEKGSFDHVSGNMSTMGAMIKGDSPEEGMGEEGENEFFASSGAEEGMMTAMDAEMGEMSGAFSEMSGDEMASFAESMGGEGMADMAASMDIDMGDIDMSQMPEGFDMGGMDMGGMDMGGMDMGGGMDFGGMGEAMGEAFGDAGGEGGMIGETGGMGEGGGMEGNGGKYQNPP